MEVIQLSVLLVQDVKKSYSSRFGGSVTHALRDISFHVEEGEFIGIMGPSGAGKTTLLNVIATIDTPTSGSIQIGGQEIVKLKEPNLSRFRRDQLGFMFQDFNLLDSLTLKENILLPLALAKVSVGEMELRVQELSAQLGIKDLLHKYPYEVSGGQKQRAAAARAVIHRPQLVLADEPTGALDSKSSRELLQCMTELNERNHTSIVLVTHDAFAASYCRRILFIKDGALFTELVRGQMTRKQFFDKILDILAALGGDHGELI